MDRGAWRTTVHKVAKESDTTEQLSVRTACTRAIKEPTRAPCIGSVES